MAVSRTFDPRGQFRPGFTVLELLVAMAVLALVIVFIAQIVSGAVGTTKLSRKKVDADNEARRIFDRLSTDIASMLDRPDADFLVKKQAGNDEIYFFAEAPARANGSNLTQSVSLVGYRINDTQQTERLSQGLSWNAAPPDGPVFLTFSGSTPIAASTLQTAYASVLLDSTKYHVVGESVFRMEIGFLLKSTSGLPATFATSPFRSGGTSPFTNKGEGLSDVQAIVVTLVILDANSRIIAGNLQGLIGKFSDSVDGATPADDWQLVANNPSSLGIPPAAAANLRVYQRIFPLNKLLLPTP